MTRALAALCLSLFACVPITPFFFDTDKPITGSTGLTGMTGGTGGGGVFRVDAITGNGAARPSGGSYVGDGIVVTGAGLDGVVASGVSLAGNDGRTFTSFTVRRADSGTLELVLGADLVAAVPVTGTLRLQHQTLGALTAAVTVARGTMGAQGATGATGTDGTANTTQGSTGATGATGPPPSYTGTNGVQIIGTSATLAAPVVVNPGSIAFNSAINDFAPGDPSGQANASYTNAIGVQLPLYRMHSAVTLGASQVSCLGNDKVISGGCDVWYDVVPASGTRQPLCHPSRSYALDDHTWYCFPNPHNGTTVNYTTTGCYTTTTALCIKSP
jgi:hypothetical protein